MFEASQVLGKRKNRCTLAGLLRTLISSTLTKPNSPPFTNIVVDEAQLFRPIELKFIRHLAPQGPDDLFFCMDRNQSIRREAFSWKDVGISVTGRSQLLRVNYRTTEEIYRFSETILGATKSQDPVESIIKGPEPEVISCSTEEEEIDIVADKLVFLVQDGLHVSEIALIAHTSDLLRQRAETALRKSGFRGSEVRIGSRPQGSYIALTTMDNAIGLEFRAVVVIGCEESNFLSAEFGMTSEQVQDVETQERRRLYVACTRARERLVLTSAGPMTHFISNRKISRATT